VASVTKPVMTLNFRSTGDADRQGWQRHVGREMSRAPYSFKQRDMTRAVKAVVAAGLAIARVEVDRDGKIVIVPGTPRVTTESSAWDKAIADLESR
jgi:hypothetical protein